MNLDTVFEEQDLRQNYIARTSTPLKNVKLDDFTGSLFSPADYYFYVFDFPSRKLERVSHHVQDLFGVDPAEFTLETLLEFCHPEDIQFVMQCEHVVSDFYLNRIRPDQIDKYKINYCIRLKTKEGNYKLFLHQALSDGTGEDGKLKKLFSIHSNISHISTENNYKISFIGLYGEPCFYDMDVFAADRYVNNTILKLSTREIEILTLFGEGYTAKQIGYFLYISEDTVRSHRKNMLNKAEQKNTTELVAHCIKKGYI